MLLAEINGAESLRELGNSFSHRFRSRIEHLVSHDAFASHAMASITAGIKKQPGARFVNSDEIEMHPKFPPTTKSKVGKWTIPHPRKNALGARIRPLWQSS